MDFLIADSSSYNFIRTRWLFGAACLAALVIGLLTLRWLLAKRAPAGGGLGAALHGWWEEEIWLGGPFWARQRQALAQGWFTAAFALFMLRWLLVHSLIPGAAILSRLLCDLIFLCIIAKLLIFTQYSAKQLARMAVFLIPFLLASAASGSQYWLYGVLFLLCAKDIDLRRAFRPVFWMVVCAVAAIMLLSLAGLIPTLEWGLGGSRPRYSFGFGHPNMAGTYLLFIVFGWLMLRFERIRWYEWFGMAVLLVFCNNAIDSRASSVGILVMIAAGLAAKYFPRLWNRKECGVLAALAPWLLAASSIWVALLYRDQDPFWTKWNAVSSDRLRLFSILVRQYPVRLFGQFIQDGEIATPDNAYINNLYTYGIICFLLYYLLLSLVLLQCWKHRWPAEAVVLISLLAYGLFEQMCWANTCPAILLFANVIYQPGRLLRISRDGPPPKHGTKKA